MPSWTVFVKALLNTMRKRPCGTCANDHLIPMSFYRVIKIS